MGDSSLTLWYHFANSKSLAPMSGLGPTLSIVRTKVASYCDNQGVLQQAASGEARFDHDPANGESLGLLVEEERRNIARQSGNLVSAPWTSIQSPAIAINDAISPRGILEATLITDNNAANREGVQQSISQPNNTDTHATSIFVRKTIGGTSPTFGLEMVYADGVGTAPVQIRLNTDTGVTNGVGDGGVQDCGDWWRLWGLSTNNFSGNRTLLVKVLPALAAHGSFVDVASTTGSAHVWGFQSEIGSTPTSYIETFGAVVIRDGDVITTPDMGWLNVLEGTMYTDTITPPIASTGVGTPAILRLDDGSESNRIIHTYDREPGFYRSFFFMTSSNGGGARNRNDTGLVLVKGDRLKMASSWGGTTYNMSCNGRPLLTDTAAIMPVGLTTLRLSALGGVVQSNGHIREIRCYNVKKDITFLQKLSSGLVSAGSGKAAYPIGLANDDYFSP